VESRRETEGIKRRGAKEVGGESLFWGGGGTGVLIVRVAISCGLRPGKFSVSSVCTIGSEKGC